MTLNQFLNYVQYSQKCPGRVHPLRWAGMLRWHENNRGSLPAILSVAAKLHRAGWPV